MRKGGRGKRDGLDEQINAHESNGGKTGRKAPQTKTWRFWSVTMTAECCKEIKAGGVKWLKSARAAWVFTFFLLSIPEREWAERERESGADRAPVHTRAFIFDNIQGGIGLLWIWSEIFQRGVGVELGPGFSAGFSLCFAEMKHTWFLAFSSD